MLTVIETSNVQMHGIKVSLVLPVSKQLLQRQTESKFMVLYQPSCTPCLVHAMQCEKSVARYASKYVPRVKKSRSSIQEIRGTRQPTCPCSSPRTRNPLLHI